MPRTAVAGAVATVEALVPEDDGSAEAAMRERLALRYNTVRPFLSLLGESDALGAAPSHQLPGPLSVQHQGQRTRSCLRSFRDPEAFADDED